MLRNFCVGVILCVPLLSSPQQCDARGPARPGSRSNSASARRRAPRLSTTLHCRPERRQWHTIGGLFETVAHEPPALPKTMETQSGRTALTCDRSASRRPRPTLPRRRGEADRRLVRALTPETRSPFFGAG